MRAQTQRCPCFSLDQVACLRQTYSLAEAPTQLKAVYANIIYAAARALQDPCVPMSALSVRFGGCQPKEGVLIQKTGPSCERLCLTCQDCS